MKRLADIARSAAPGKAMQLRGLAYGSRGIENFLRDVMAMANASVDGPRYIVVGIDIDAHGNRQIHTISEQDFRGKPAYRSLANDYIEPPLRIRYEPVSLDGKRVGVFEIGHCEDRPYMMRVDFSETLRRGDAYMRLKETAVKMGRRQLQSLFEKKFHDSVPADNIEIGFMGEILHKALTLSSSDISQLPSSVAAGKLEQLVKIHQNSRNSGATSLMARLVHARLYGSDDPYVRRTPEELLEEMEQIRYKYRDQDLFYLFEKHRTEIQLGVRNQGDESIIDASIALVLPKDDDFFVAERLPKIERNKKYVERFPDEIASYPSVSVHKNAIHITKKIGDIPVEQAVEVFASPVRVCIGPGLIGRRFGLRYALHGQNLRSPAVGTLRLNFRANRST